MGMVLPLPRAICNGSEVCMILVLGGKYTVCVCVYGLDGEWMQSSGPLDPQGAVSTIYR